jgi:hypothetical protein
MPKSTARTTRQTKPAGTASTAKTAHSSLTTQPPRPPHEPGIAGMLPANGTVRACVAQRGELLRHRVMSADGRDVAVTTVAAPVGFVTAAYPVQQGYLVMVCQPLYEVSSGSIEPARDEHTQLVRILAEAGVHVARARRKRALIELAEQQRIGAEAVLSATA